jgi:PII-like signaling protein
MRHAGLDLNAWAHDCLTLTTYFGERDRTPRGLLADELMDLYGRHRLRTSVLLRGAEGFGGPHHLHTDRLLTLSEDLPVIAIAVDRRERIEALLEPVMQLQHRGLLTLERIRMCSDGVDAGAEAVGAETGMIDPGSEAIDPGSEAIDPGSEAIDPGAEAIDPGAEAIDADTDEVGRERLPPQLNEAAKLTIYLGRQERIAGKPAYTAITDLLHRRGIAGATVLLGVDGTRDGRRERAQFLARNAGVPTLIVAVGAGERIAAVLPYLDGLLRKPLLTLERVRVCKRDGRLLEKPHELPGRDEHGLELWQKLTVYTSQAATYQGHPLSLQIIRRLREADAAGATSIRGIWGFHGEHPPHGDRFLQIRRHVPVVTVVVDTPERIARSFALIDELTVEHGLVTSEMVPTAWWRT